MLVHEITTGPATELIGVTDIKTHAQIEHTGDDTYLETIRDAAINAITNFLQRSLITQTITLRFNQADLTNPLRFHLPNALTITSITAYHKDDTTTVVGSTNYAIHGNGRFLYFKTYNDYVFPTNLRPWDTWEVIYTAGYGAATTDVPDNIILAALQYATLLNDDRDGNMRNSLPDSIRTLLTPYKSRLI